MQQFLVLPREPPPCFPKLSEKKGKDVVGSLRLGKYTPWFNDVKQTDVLDKCVDALSLLSKTHGCEMVEILIPELAELRTAHLATVGTDMHSVLGPHLNDGKSARLTYESLTSDALFRSFTGPEYVSAQRLRVSDARTKSHWPSRHICSYELEWLEANSLFPEEDDLVPAVHPDEEPPQSPPESPTLASISGQKRRLSHCLDSSNLGEEGTADDVIIEPKKTKVHDDEDWLRYSPTRDSRDTVGAPMEEDPVEERIVSKFISQIEGDFIPVTAPGGEDRVYAKLCTVQTDRGAIQLDLKSKSGGLLVEPINVLFEKAEQLAFNKALKASVEVQTDAVLPETGLVSEKLWVDKYAPNSFTELLSDEQTNREVLLWLKQWDSCVFGSDIISTSDEVLSALRRHSTVPQRQKVSDTAFTRKTRGFKKGFGNDRRYDRSSDFENEISKQTQDAANKKTRPSGPPEQKILLLCGPPGLGKTTLAHVASDHCGYRVVEVNASDDRSSSSIEAKILDVVQMNSVTADSRPKCLVIDEIDGALGDGKGAVDAILKMVSSDKKAETGNENLAKGELSGRALSKKGRKAASLSRPLEIGSQVVGRKDQSKGVFDIWKEIFQRRKFKGEKKYESSYANKSDDFDYLHSRLSNRGDYDMIMDGIHENFLHLQYHDPVMQKTVKCMNSLGVFDVVQQYIWRTMQMPLYVYQSPLAITVHHIVAQIQRPNIEWPKSYQRHRTILAEKLELLKAWHSKMPPHIFRHLSTKSFAEDSVSSLLHILSPSTIRPVALHLHTDKEKKDMDQLVSKMVSYSITYKTAKPNPFSSNPDHHAASDVSTLTFDPPITEFISFKGYACPHNSLPSAMKQVLAHEVEKRRILEVSKSANVMESCNEANSDSMGRRDLKETSSSSKYAGPFAANKEKVKEGVIAPTTTTAISSSSKVEATKSCVPNVTCELPKKKKSSGASSFFDRFRKASGRASRNADTNDHKAATLERDSRPVLFKYNEGFTNAVKRPVKMREFLI
ncbi:Fatty acid amide hydrolase [Linum grandiflorum]